MKLFSSGTIKTKVGVRTQLLVIPPPETRSRSPVSRNAKPEHEVDLQFHETPNRNAKPISDFEKRLPAARNRSKRSQNAFPPREMGKNLRKTPSRRGKWGKISEKRLPAAGNGKKRSKNGFPRREKGKNARKTVSRGGKAVKFSGDRFPATGNGAFSPKNAFRRRITLRALPQTSLHTTRCRAKKVASRNRVSFRLQLFRDLMATLPTVRTKGGR